MDTDPLCDPAIFGTGPAQVGRGALHPGAVFEGRQQSGRNSYRVKVSVETVDIPAGTLCGLLEIHGLTPQLDSLVTFFEGEIIGTQSGFVTGRWGATEADDLKHWNRFAPFRSLKNSLTKPNLTYNHLNRPFLFMRWKERFVVPEYKVQNINGASYSGFYFLCLEFNDPSASSLNPSSHIERGRRESASHSPRRLSVPASLSPPPAVSTPTSTTPPTRPSATPITGRARSVSRTAGSFSYAAAVRGSSWALAPPTPSPPSPAPSTSVPPLSVTETSAKDEVTTPSSETIPPAPSTSPPSSTSAIADEPGSPLPILINLPTPQGTTEDDFPMPSSPPPVRHSIGARRASVASIDKERDRDRFVRSRDRDGERKSAGGVNMSGATITGWYFFKHSEPFQQLSLQYVPQLNGGRQSFAFR